MVVFKKIDRAFQWAGEKIGQGAQTNQSDEFKALENEMNLRHSGMERLQKSMNSYVKSMSNRGETFGDKEKGLPVSYLGRTMMAHGEDFEPDSEFGNGLIVMGRANERISGIQETYIANASSSWLDSLERSLAMMKEYQSARKKLENRRLTYDSNSAKIQKARRDDYRLEEELRASKAKYEESSEDVYRRMMDIKEAEAESVRDLTTFLDAELDYYERCAEELRRAREDMLNGQSSSPPLSRRPTHSPSQSRTIASRSYSDRTDRYANSRHEEYEEPAYEQPPRMPTRPGRFEHSPPSIPESSRPMMGRATTHGGTFEGPTSRQISSSYREAPPPPPEPISRTRTTPMPPPGNVSSLRGNLRPVGRVNTNYSTTSSNDVFADGYDTTSSGSPEYERSESPATSYGSLSRSTSNTGLSTGGAMKKAPPPPPPSRSKKPAPPIPAKRDLASLP